MLPIGCSETSEGDYHYSLRNNPEERISHQLRSGSLKPRKVPIELREGRETQGQYGAQ